MSHENYSGVVINQNQKIGSATDYVSISDSTWRYQDFVLPSDYPRGSDDGEIVYPALTGFQLLTEVTDTDTVELDWVLEYKQIGVDWIRLSTGTLTEAHLAGSKVWLDILFPTPVDISPTIFNNRLRVGVRNSATSGIAKIWLSSPNPSAFVTTSTRCYTYPGGVETPIQIASADTSFNFRILGLIADEGIDFLGNRFRSATITRSVDNTDTLHSASIDKIWMSKPNPSRFAVESLYFDVRGLTPNSSTLIGGLGHANYVSNSSFETNTTGWTNGTYFVNSGATITRISSEYKRGTHSGKIVTTSSSSNQGKMFTLGTLPAGTYIASMWIKGESGGEAVDVFAGRGNATATIESETLDTGWTLYYILFTTDGLGACYVGVRTTGSTAYTFFIDDIRVGGYEPEDLDGYPSVVDNVIVDPITPGIWFNVYYSSDGDPVETEAEWDNKLWRRVPKVFHAAKRESHKLPKPIIAKYIKIEFTHLQAQHYSPGQLSQPIRYKKHPKWVLDYFLTVLDRQNSTSAIFSGTHGVIFDAYDLAYNYYLDDIRQEPDQPIEITSDSTQDINNFLKNRQDFSDQIDPIMANKISTALTPYADGPSYTNIDTLIARAASAVDPTLPIDYPIEYSPTGLYPDIIELRSSEMIIENQTPVMFFYITCRHRYREITASLSHDRAYFAGVREIAFTRDKYYVPHDDTHYIESGADFVNTERNDFVNDNGVLVV